MVGVTATIWMLALGCGPAADSPNNSRGVSQPVEPARKAESNWTPEVEARGWRYIVLHHTATDRGSVESIHEAHLRRKWLGIGYHFLIGNGQGMPDGKVEATFRWRTQLHGAHAGTQTYNDTGIGIALVGNFENAPPTKRQLEAVKALVADLSAAHGIASNRVVPHRDVRATACPGRHFPIEDVANAAGPPDPSTSSNRGRTTTRRRLIRRPRPIEGTRR